MATKVHMEALSPTMEEGQLVQWLKNEGDTIASGDVLAEVETDKATMELVARGDGILRKIFLGAGKSLELDRVMAHDLIKKMNDKEQLDRYAVKRLETYQPAGVLEGGNAFADLPGQNDVDVGCMAQTREGIKEAGVVFVLLSKSLYEDDNSLRLLRETDTIKRAAAGEANVVFLFNRETQPNFKHRQL